MKITAHKSARKKKRGLSIRQQKKADALAKKLGDARPERNSPYAAPVVRDTAAGRLKLSDLSKG